MKYSVYEPSPIIAVDYIKHLIEGKVVYDIGCGSGEFAKAMARYANKVVGIELDFSLAEKSRAKGIKTLSNDFMVMDLNEAEVVYAYLSFIGNYALTRKLKNWHGTVISLLYPLHNSLTEIIKPDEIIHVEEGDISVPFLIYKL